MEQANHYYRKLNENVLDSWVGEALMKSLNTAKNHIDVKVAEDMLDLVIIQEMTSNYKEVCLNCAKGGPGNVFVPRVEPIVEDPLLAVLATVGIYGEHKVEPKFSNDLHLILDCAKYFPLYFAGSLIVDIDIPVFGCERIDKMELGKLDVSLVNKDTHRSGYYMAMREKKDGVLSLAIKVTTADGELHTLYWDEERISCSNFVAHGVYERMDTYYWQLSGNYTPMLNGLSVVYSNWYTLSKTLLDSSKEGVVLLIDGVEYKLPREKTITLEKIDDEYYDREKKKYEVVGSGGDGFSDFIVRGNKLCFFKTRLDKSMADTSKAINFIIHKMAVVSDILNLFPSQLPSKVEKITVEKCSSYKDKRSIRAQYVYYDHKTYKRFDSIIYMSMLREVDLSTFFLDRNEYYSFSKRYPRYRHTDIKSFFFHGVEFYQRLVPGAEDFEIIFNGTRRIRASGYMKVFFSSLLVKVHNIDRDIVKDQFPAVVTLAADVDNLMLLMGTGRDVKSVLHWINSSFSVDNASYEISMGPIPKEVYD